MSTEQCWAMHRDGSGCAEPVVPGSRFCQSSGRNGGPGPLQVWRPPLAEPAVDVPAAKTDPVAPSPLTTIQSAVPVDEPAVAPPSGVVAAREEEGLDWLMSLLRQTMTEVVAGDTPPLQKANAVACLGSLYLRAHRTAENKQAKKVLKRQVAELEERVAELEESLLPTNPAERARLASGELNVIWEGPANQPTLTPHRLQQESGSPDSGGPPTSGRRDPTAGLRKR